MSVSFFLRHSHPTKSFSMTLSSNLKTSFWNLGPLGHGLLWTPPFFWMRRGMVLLTRRSKYGIYLGQGEWKQVQSWRGKVFFNQKSSGYISELARHTDLYNIYIYTYIAYCILAYCVWAISLEQSKVPPYRFMRRLKEGLTSDLNLEIKYLLTVFQCIESYLFSQDVNELLDGP